MEGSETFCGWKRVVSRPDVPFWGIVDDKSCLGFQIKPIFGEHSMQNLL